MALDPIQSLHDILKQEKWNNSWTSGTLDLRGDTSELYLKCKDGSSRLVQFGSTPESHALEAFVAASQPMTRASDSQGVLDEGYHTLDANSFSWKFNPNSDEFIAELANGLHAWNRCGFGIRVEPNHISVCAQGSSTWKHQEIPRSDVFGTLVFVLPVRHQGGNLVLHHAGRKIEFCTSTQIEAKGDLSVTYFAFSSDVEVQAGDVLSGHCISIAFTIYFDPSRTPPPLMSNFSPIPDNLFTQALRNLLDDGDFLSSHSHLVFGLNYNYPQSANEYEVQDLSRCLEGEDLYLFQALSQMGVRPRLGYLYQSTSPCDFWVILKNVVNGRLIIDEESPDTQLDYLLSQDDAKIVWAKGMTETSSEGERRQYRRHPWFVAYFGDVDRYRARTLSVDWVTEPSSHSLSGYTGGEFNETYFYTVCILVDL